MVNVLPLYDVSFKELYCSFFLLKKGNNVDAIWGRMAPVDIRRISGGSMLASSARFSECTVIHLGGLCDESYLMIFFIFGVFIKSLESLVNFFFKYCLYIVYRRVFRILLRGE